MPHEQFQSPFSWRYGSDAMRSLWSEVHKRRLWRRVWVALARSQAAAGIVTPEQVADLEAHVETVDIERALTIEAEIHHDLMAEVQAYAEQCPVGGGIIHLGATSADIEDNADVLRIRDSLRLIADGVRVLLLTFAERIDQHADDVTMAMTHLQPAEPTTIGYRLALYAHDLLEDYHALTGVLVNLRGKGFKGAVGTRAAYMELLHDAPRSAAHVEAVAMDALGLPYFTLTGQTYPRKQDWQVVSALAGVAATLHRFAFDVRILQSPVLGEWAEPFGTRQVGSSAMPFKRNPINAEKIDSLARLVAAQVPVAWSNAALSLLERTLDDSANRREMLPIAFLATDEILLTTQRIVAGLRVDTATALRLVERFGTFAAVERVLMAAARAGADRQTMHEVLRQHSLSAWADIGAGAANPLPELLAQSEALRPYLTPEQVRLLLDARAYVGDAPARARDLAAHIRTLFSA